MSRAIGPIHEYEIFMNNSRLGYADARTKAAAMRQFLRDRGPYTAAERRAMYARLKSTHSIFARKNPTKAQKRPTKLQRLMASTKRGKQKRMAKALSAYMKARNPGTKYAGAKVMKNPGGSITIIPIKLRRAK